MIAGDEYIKDTAASRPPSNDSYHLRRLPIERMQTWEISTSELKGGGFLALPDRGAPHPGVVVIHEVHGLNEDIRKISRRFADAGYAALAVDMFTGRNRAICMTRYMAGMLMGSLQRLAESSVPPQVTRGDGPPQPCVAPSEYGARARPQRPRVPAPRPPYQPGKTP